MVFPSIIRSSKLYIQHQYMSYRFVDCMLQGTGWNIWCPLPNLYDINLMLYLQF